METPMKQQLSDLLTLLSWADISRTYFGKSNSWLYHKLNGIDGNGKPTTFSDDERTILKNALEDISKRVTNAANAL